MSTDAPIGLPGPPDLGASALPDGTYDAFVINADDLPTDGGATTALELTITSGEQSRVRIAP